MRILFILKRRHDYGHHHHHADGLSTGLFQSVRFIVKMLTDLGYDARMEVVIDNNDIDREVTKHKPDLCIIEALWVVPEKFDILKRLHPKVRWMVRLHSDVAFIANEGIAMGWIHGYFARGVAVSINSISALHNLAGLGGTMDYLPNFYPMDFTRKQFLGGDPLHIGCFGAIRPLKNQLAQAIAAIRFAEKRKRSLIFHINVGRIEMAGGPVFHNLRDLFANTPNAKLELHEWTGHDDFLKLCLAMDIGMQVSFTETFDIIAADFIAQGVPLVGSDEIPWSSNLFNAQETSVDSMVYALDRTWKLPQINVKLNQRGLATYSLATERAWEAFLG